MSETVSAPAGMPDGIADQVAAAIAAEKAREEARQKAEAEALAASLAAMQAANADAKPTVFPADEVAAPRNKAGVAGFGPTFAAELAAAGTAGMLFAASPDHITFDPAIPAADRAKVMAVIRAHNPDTLPVAIPPDCPSLAFWLTALDLWMRDDGQGGKVARTTDVQDAVAKLVAANNPLGKLAARQLEYANTVVLADLLKLAPAFNFSAADCAESLWRADRVAKGDLTGVWPLQA